MTYSISAWNLINSMKQVDKWTRTIQANINGATRVGYKQFDIFYGGGPTTTLEQPSLVANGKAIAETFYNVGNTQIDFSQGGLIPSDKWYHVAIDGEGFFMTTAKISNPSPEDIQYTRDGEFYIDGDGLLRTKEGLYVLDGTSIPGDPNPSVTSVPPWAGDPIFGNYNYRERLKVENKKSYNLTDETVFELKVNTLDLFNSGKVQSDLNDLRIGYWNGSSWQAVDMVIENPNAPAPITPDTNTVIRFRVKDSIAAGQSIVDKYYLFYGNPSETGYNVPANVIGTKDSDAVIDDYNGSSYNPMLDNVSNTTTSVEDWLNAPGFVSTQKWSIGIPPSPSDTWTGIAAGHITYEKGVGYKVNGKIINQTEYPTIVKSQVYRLADPLAPGGYKFVDENGDEIMMTVIDGTTFSSFAASPFNKNPNYDFTLSASDLNALRNSLDSSLTKWEKFTPSQINGSLPDLTNGSVTLSYNSSPATEGRWGDVPFTGNSTNVTDGAPFIPVGGGWRTGVQSFTDGTINQMWYPGGTHTDHVISSDMDGLTGPDQSNTPGSLTSGDHLLFRKIINNPTSNPITLTISTGVNAFSRWYLNGVRFNTGNYAGQGWDYVTSNQQYTITLNPGDNELLIEAFDDNWDHSTIELNTVGSSYTNTINDNFSNNSNWTTVFGSLTISGGVYSNLGPNGSSVNDSMAYLNTPINNDFTLQTEFSLLDASGPPQDCVAFQFRKTNSSDDINDSGYAVICQENGRVELVKANGLGGVTVLDSITGFNFVAGNHTVKIETIGTTINVYIDGASTPTLSANDSSYTSGYIGFRTTNNNSPFSGGVDKWQIDNFSLTNTVTTTSSPINIKADSTWEVMDARGKNTLWSGTPTALDSNYTLFRQRIDVAPEGLIRDTLNIALEGFTSENVSVFLRTTSGALIPIYEDDTVGNNFWTGTLDTSLLEPSDPVTGATNWIEVYASTGITDDISDWIKLDMSKFEGYQAGDITYSNGTGYQFIPQQLYLKPDGFDPITGKRKYKVVKADGTEPTMEVLTGITKETITLDQFGLVDMGTVPNNSQYGTTGWYNRTGTDIANYPDKPNTYWHTLTDVQKSPGDPMTTGGLGGGSVHISHSVNFSGNLLQNPGETISFQGTIFADDGWTLNIKPGAYTDLPASWRSTWTAPAYGDGRLAFTPSLEGGLPTSEADLASLINAAMADGIDTDGEWIRLYSAGNFLPNTSTTRKIGVTSVPFNLSLPSSHFSQNNTILLTSLDGDVGKYPNRPNTPYDTGSTDQAWSGGWVGVSGFSVGDGAANNIKISSRIINGTTTVNRYQYDTATGRIIDLFGKNGYNAHNPSYGHSGSSSQISNGDHVMDLPNDGTGDDDSRLFDYVPDYNYYSSNPSVATVYTLSGNDIKAGIRIDGGLSSTDLISDSGTIGIQSIDKLTTIPRYYTDGVRVYDRMGSGKQNAPADSNSNTSASGTNTDNIYMVSNADGIFGTADDEGLIDYDPGSPLDVDSLNNVPNYTKGRLTQFDNNPGGESRIMVDSNGTNSGGPIPPEGPDGDGIQYKSSDTWNDYNVTFDFGFNDFTSGESYTYLRYQNQNNWIRLKYNPTSGLSLEKNVGGSITNLATSSSFSISDPINLGSKIKIEVEGRRYSVYDSNGNLLINYIDNSSNPILYGRLAVGANKSAWWDNMQVTTLARNLAISLGDGVIAPNGPQDILDQMYLIVFRDKQGQNGLRYDKEFGGTYFEETVASGRPRALRPGVDGAGILHTSMLETSNVDMNKQITHLAAHSDVYDTLTKQLMVYLDTIQSSLSLFR